MGTRRQITVMLDADVWKQLDALARNHNLSKQELVEPFIHKIMEQIIDGALDVDVIPRTIKLRQKRTKVLRQWTR